MQALRVCGAIALAFGAMVSMAGRSQAAAESATLADDIFLNGFEQFTLSINDYLGQCSIRVNGGAPTSAPDPMQFPEGTIVSLHADANPTFAWRYWSGTDNGDPDTNADTTVAMVGDRAVLACCQTLDQTTCGPTLTVTRLGVGAGTVTSDIPGIDCGNDCGEIYPANTHVVLTAVAQDGSKFVGWSGGGCSGTGTCQVTIDSVLAIDATFDLVLPNKVFVTSATFTASRGGLAGADASCNTAAAAGGLTGTYRAWLSTTTTNAKDRLAGARGWIRTDGKPVADQVSDIVSGHLFYPISVDQSGVFVGDAAVATATSVTGNYITNDCMGWTSTTGSVLAGNAQFDAGSFTSVGTMSCGSPSRMYCFGIDNAVAVAPPVVSARRAFLTGWAPGGGIASADAKCATDAVAANLAGSFKALLATSTASALARFDTGVSALPWARPDDTLLASTAAALGSATYLDASPTSNAANTLWYANYGVWSGAASLTAVGTVSSTCNNWTSTLGSDVGVAGRSDATKIADWRGGLMTPCSANYDALVCLQQ